MWKVKNEVAVPVFLALPNQALSSESQLQEVLPEIIYRGIGN